MIDRVIASGVLLQSLVVKFAVRRVPCNFYFDISTVISTLFSVMSQTRSTRNSKKHLSSDYDWEGIGDLLHTSVLERGNELLQDLASSHDAELPPPEISAVPLAGQEASLGDQHFTDHVFTLPSPGCGAIPKDGKSILKPSRTPETANPAIKKRVNALELEVRKLELQLELARFTQAAPQLQKAGDESSKSLGDLKAPQKTRFPQPWPHIYAPGEPKLYSDLSLAEFCTGYIAILEQYPDSSHRFPPGVLLHHFNDLMVLACTYQWSAVCAYHYKVLRSIELGLVRWGDSFEPLKQPFFIPTTLLPSPDLVSKGVKSPSKATPPSSSIQRSDICDAWSWYDDCANSACPKLHVCVVCKRSDHRAINCPKRKFPVPTRRQDPPSRD